MGLLQIAARLDSTRIENLEVIAKKTSAYNQSDYNNKFALEIVRQKIENSNLPYHEFSDDFPYIIDEGNGILIGVSADLLLPKLGKSYLDFYAKKLKRELVGHDGMIQFMSSLINGSNTKDILKKEIGNIEFVNLAYDMKSLERRFRGYGSR